MYRIITDVKHSPR